MASACSLVLAVCAVAACGDNSDVKHESPYWLWNGQRQIGASNFDDLSASTRGPTADGYALAADDGDALVVYGHQPGVTFSMDTLEAVLVSARDHHLPFVTFADLAANTHPGAALCLSFDDDSIDLWFGIRDLLAKYGAHATFFVTRYPQFTDDGRAELRTLAADGDDIEAHSIDHVSATDYVAAHGLAAYLSEQVIPSIELLRADGYHPVAFAYPFGAHTDEIDQALVPLIPITRGISDKEIP